MLHILLLILKITGIVIAVLIGCIILSLCLALFVPVHYRAELKRTEGESCPPIEVNAKVTWLFGFINIRVLYPADVYLRARILFFTLFRIPEKKKKEKEKKNVNGEKTENLKKDKQTEENDESIENKGDGSIAEEIPEEETQYTKEKLPLKSRINKILGSIKNIWYTLKRICGKIKEIIENIEYYLEVIKSDTFKKAFLLSKDELFSIFSYIKPRKFIADLIIGAGDPAATGQILSYYGILYPLIGNNVTVTGDFERKRIEGSVFFKGKIKFFTFLKAVIRIYFNKDIRKLLKLFKKEDA